MAVEIFRVPRPAIPEIKFANPNADGDMYRDKRYGVLGSKGESVFCCVESCSTFPQTVCPACLGYVCEGHIYRHPNCSEGR